MKKFIINNLLFGCCFILIFSTLELIFKNTIPSADRYKWQYEELFSPTVKADIVIFGTSKSVRGINPKLIENNNISVYNFALNGSNPEFIFKWYNKFFKKYYPKPKLVIFEINWLMFNEKWMSRNIEQDSKYFPTSDYLNEIFISAENKVTTFFNRYYILNRSFGTGGIIDSTYNGYTPLAYNMENFKPISDFKPFNPNRQQKFFDMLLETFNKDNLDVIFVMLPERINPRLPSYSIVKENKDYIEEKIEKYVYLNYHNEFDNDSLFSDWGHLNIRGAKILSELMKKDIEAKTYNTFNR